MQLQMRNRRKLYVENESIHVNGRNALYERTTDFLEYSMLSQEHTRLIESPQIISINSDSDFDFDGDEMSGFFSNTVDVQRLLGTETERNSTICKEIKLN
mgnify:CR=1 FL=1